MSTAMISHANCLAHNVGNEHPECPNRLHAINDRLISSGLSLVLPHHDAKPVSREQLLNVHDQAYIDDIYAQAPTQAGQIVRLDDDTALMKSTLTAAQYAAGAGVQAVDMIMQGKHQRIFCPVRPPGHHAESDKAMGFCYFNNIAIAATHALNHYGLTRVAIIDFDVHHGNGTEQIFAGDSRVLFCSSFEHPLYPFSGHNSQHDNIHNLPLQSGLTGAQYRTIVSEQWLPIVDAFAPELILISAGFDGHIEDDISHIGLTESDYRWITTELVTLAEKHCQGQIVSMLEGGYALSALGRSVSAHLDALL
ncbi:MAG: acetoin utilization deacetylase AcuC-like enzyme [Phenylobacterium sp.]|jgi:acetoin utilization deacetylase AcuC-like enzyme